MKIGIIVARLQTDNLHPGHCSLIESVQKESDGVVIILGVARAKSSVKNPLNFKTRRLMVQEKYPVIHCIPLDDNASDAIWSKNLDVILDSMSMGGGNDITLFHSRDSFVSCYSGVYPTKECEAMGETTGTSVRENIGTTGPIANDMFRKGIIFNAFDRYPICNPVVDMFVFDSKTRKVLLGRRKNAEEWRLPGGFVDISDSNYKAAAIRELQEETGLSINSNNFKALDSFKINDWGYSETGKDRIFSTLFWVDYDGDQESIANDDISEVGWFDIHAVDGSWIDKPLIITDEHRPLIKCAMAYYYDNVAPKVTN